MASFERLGGALLASFLVLAAFSGIVAILNRDTTYLLFAGWLITSLRVAAINGGWDLNWIGVILSPTDNLLFIRATLAAHGMFSLALFYSLFRDEPQVKPVARILQTLTAIYGVMVIASSITPHGLFMRVFWAFSGVTLLFIFTILGALLVRNPTRIVKWYAGSWGILMAGMLFEIAFQAGIVIRLSTLLNAQVASTVSAIVMGIALAERLRTEREARIAAQARALEVLQKFKENYNSMPIGLFVSTPNGAITLRNPEFCKMFSISDSDERSQNLSSLLGEGPARTVLQAVEHTPVADCEVLSEQADGEQRWFLARIKRSADGIEGSIQDISARKQAEEKLKRLVTHDSLTGLLNRRGLDIALERLLDSARLGKACAVAYVDLDRFKVVNDLHGHATGDAVLRVVAQRLQESVRIQDSVARIADSFLVIFNDCPDYAVEGLSERIRESISGHPFEANGKVLSVTVSIGVVQVDPVMQAVDVIATADRACMEAKTQGRNRVVFLNDKDNSLRSHLDEMKLVADMHGNALTERYFLEFQPIIALTSAQLSLNYEVLIRMRGLDGEIIPPGRFIGAAERNGLMSHIDRWVLKSTLEWLDTHPAHRDRLNFATLNISGASLNDARFVEDAFAMIADHPLAVTKLCFEITESVALHDIGSTRSFVDRLRRCGAKLALDDFGAGYTSFNYLKEIPADLIKIDGSFVRDINRNPANYAITRMIVDLTHELGMESIAEWAETPDTVKALIGLGVDYGQGFGLARPMDKRIVTAANSGLELVKDQRVAELISRARDVRIHMV